MTTGNVVPFRGVSKRDTDPCGEVLELLRQCNVVLAHTTMELSEAIAIAEGTKSMRERGCGERLRSATQELRNRL